MTRTFLKRLCSKKCAFGITERSKNYASRADPKTGESSSKQPLEFNMMCRKIQWLQISHLNTNGSQKWKNYLMNNGWMKYSSIWKNSYKFGNGNVTEKRQLEGKSKNIASRWESIELTGKWITSQLVWRLVNKAIIDIKISQNIT